MEREQSLEERMQQHVLPHLRNGTFLEKSWLGLWMGAAMLVLLIWVGLTALFRPLRRNEPRPSG